MLVALRRFYSRDYTPIYQCYDQIYAIGKYLTDEMEIFWGDPLRVDAETDEHLAERYEHWFSMYTSFRDHVAHYTRLEKRLFWFERRRCPELSAQSRELSLLRVRAAMFGVVVKDRMNVRQKKQLEAKT